MPEVLTELVAKIKADSAELEKGLTDAERKTEASSKKMQDSLKKVGTVMAASGAAITAALGLMGKAAIDEEINIKRLATTINNSGTAYDNVKDSLEAVIAATQRKTGVADDEQRDILNRLILVTNDYNKALSLLPTVLDLAAAGEMDATTAATYLGKAYLELEDGAEEVSVRFGQASLQFKNMEDIQNRVAGAAENLANPLSVLKASIGDVAESIGANLIPIIKGAVDKIVDIAIKIQDWIKENPELAKQITLVAGALGIFLGVAGAILILAPKIKAAWISLQLVFTASPWGAIIAGIGLLIAAGILLWQNWDKVSHFFADVWSNMKNAVLHGVDAMLSYLEKFIGWIPCIGDKIRDAREAIAGMIDRERISRDIRDTERDLEGLTKTVKEEFDKQASEIQSSYNKQRGEAKKTYDAAIDAINKEYGVAESTTKNRIELAKEATSKLKDSYEREKDAAKDRYDSEMDSVRELYSERLTLLEAETDATVKALQSQIDAIDEQTEAEELAITRAEEQKRLATLKGAEYDEYAAEIARNELLRTRSEEKDALRDRIEEAREGAKSRKEQIQIEEDAALASLKTKYEAELENYRNLANAADINLANELRRIEIDRVAALDAEKQKLDATLLSLDTEEKAKIEFMAGILARQKEHIKDINIAYDSLQKRYDIEIVTHHIDVAEGGGGGGETITLKGGRSSYAGEFATGGVVPGVVGQPYLATVHGGETIIPANESAGNVVVNFTQPVFFDREDTMNKFVDMIRKGIQRQDRLRFGGAYSG